MEERSGNTLIKGFEKINYLEDYPNFEDLPMVAEGRVEYGDK